MIESTKVTKKKKHLAKKEKFGKTKGNNSLVITKRIEIIQIKKSIT